MKSHQSGFTAVELLITLFVAAAFLIAAYQLFNVVIKDGGQARAESRAANVAYDYLRRYSPFATNPCSNAVVVSNEPITIDGLSNALIRVTMSCPPGYVTRAISKVEVSITYNSPPQTLKFATYANGYSTDALDVTTGLVGWWKFNGNASDVSGNDNNGTVNGATPTIGQNGQANNAYSFNGTSAYIDNGTGTSLSINDNLTLSAWIRPTNYHTVGYYSLKNIILARGPATTYNYALQATDDTTISFIKRTGSEGLQFYHFNSLSNLTNTWTHVVMTVQGTTATLYINGSLSSSKVVGPISAVAGDRLYIGGAGATLETLFSGSIDDVRIYNRIISPTEVQTLFSRGAQ